MKTAKARGPRRGSCYPAGAALLLLLGLSPPAYAAQADYCASNYNKASATIEMSSATTTQLVAAVAGESVFVCGFSMSIAGSATTAAAAKLIQGTGSNCGSNAADLTGAFGSNDAAVSTTPTVVSYGNGGATVLATGVGDELCITTTGNAVLTQGVVTYVQASGESFP